MARDYKYVDIDKVNERAAELLEEEEENTDSTQDVLVDTLLDLIQIAEENGMEEDEINGAVTRVVDYRAANVRKRFRLHTSNDCQGDDFCNCGCNALT